MVAKSFAILTASKARERLEGAWLSVDEHMKSAVGRFATGKFEEFREVKKVLLWNRAGNEYEKTRNTSEVLLDQLRNVVCDVGDMSITIGHEVAAQTRSATNITKLWADPPFNTTDSHRAHLWFVKHLRDHYGLIAQMGNRSGGMDGHARLELPTYYFDGASEKNQERMTKWVGPIPEFDRLVLKAQDQAGLPILGDGDAETLAAWLAAV